MSAAPFSTVAQVDPRWDGAFPVIGLAKHFRCLCLEMMRNIATASRRITAVSTPITTAMYVGSSCFAVETGSSPSAAPFFSTKTSLWIGDSVVGASSGVKLPWATSAWKQSPAQGYSWFDDYEIKRVSRSLSDIIVEIIQNQGTKNIGKTEQHFASTLFYLLRVPWYENPVRFERVQGKGVYLFYGITPCVM